MGRPQMIFKLHLVCNLSLLKSCQLSRPLLSRFPLRRLLLTDKPRRVPTQTQEQTHQINAPLPLSPVQVDTWGVGKPEPHLTCQIIPAKPQSSLWSPDGVTWRQSGLSCLPVLWPIEGQGIRGSYSPLCHQSLSRPQQAAADSREPGFAYIIPTSSDIPSLSSGPSPPASATSLFNHANKQAFKRTQEQNGQGQEKL